VLAGIYNATQVNGFAAAFAENETMYRENPDYVLSWLTHGLLEADIAQADGSGHAIQIARGMIDWFSNVSKNWLLPEFMPPDRTVATDIPPVYGANTGHQIYLISQGIIHHSRMATSALGRQRDVSCQKTTVDCQLMCSNAQLGTPVSKRPPSPPGAGLSSRLM
jgi:hypothetical protein